MVILVTGWFEIRNEAGHYTGKKEFLTSHGVDNATGRIVIVPTDHPQRLGARFDVEIGEWVIDN